MNLLSVENITKSYSEKLLLNNIFLGINEGDKIGLIGVNGTGKSTLLKIIAGLEDADEGRIVKGNTVSIEYLPQQPDFDLDITVIEQVFKGTSPIMRLLQEYEKETSKPNPSGNRILSLTKQMDSLNAWSVDAEAKSVLTRLGITDFNAIIGTLSGGQRKRIALATALINPSDLLIMDEPTNHLDNDTIDWLEQYLNKRKGALLMVTHDRYFLDRITNQIIELDGGSLYAYSGNYSTFLEQKLQREESLASSERKRQSLLRKELEWIKRGAKARSTKQKARIQRFEELSTASYSASQDKVEISTASTRLGKKVIEIQDICKGFDNRELIRDFTYIVLRDDRVGIIGPNGCGKSTLINLISGALQPDSGTIDIGDTVKIGVYSQETLHLDDSMRVIDYVW
jgi:ATP-binding cassette subfamily F protein uup